MFTPSPLTLQSKARFTALQYRAVPLSFPPSIRNRAEFLALHVREYKPGIYCSGACLVDTWRSLCTCQAWRSVSKTTRQPCVHMLAVWLATGLSPWDTETTWLKEWCVNQNIIPPIIGYTCRLRGVSGLWVYNSTRETGWLELTRPNDPTVSCFALPGDVLHFRPIYGDN